ncbi:MAG: carboxy-S-adenosyl-L-methionine synthase CmoA [Proteobacteria bacterium]|nr:carboxy-S-adenosyl-L-methionine synthase CmoA [Pseudomonadota bacterium]MBU1715879.1 carboxy-S-adenosyl-L-methionine synthase CmoA [Pseudomonadota bacterium]
MNKDEIYKNKEVKEDFRFNRQVAEVFDDMLSRSVPCYGQVMDLSTRILTQKLQPGDTIFDLGCSTGTTLIELARRLPQEDLQFVGFDNSAAMIGKASSKAEMYTMKDRLNFIEQDITELDLQDGGAIIMNYTLQFIRPMMRQEFIKKIRTFLRPGGVLIISEKVISHDPMLNRTFIDLYLDFKRESGYSELEISRKREAMENILIPFSVEENLTLMKDAGFSSVETFFRWFNFSSFVAIK